MKLALLICVFWTGASIGGIPNRYEQWIHQTRSIANTDDVDLPEMKSVHENDSNQLGSEEINDSENNKDEEVEAIPVNEVGLEDEAEPVENFLSKLKEKAEEPGSQDDEETKAAVKVLQKTMSETPTQLARVFVNKAWHLFDFGALGTTRRTRNLQDVTYLSGLLNTIIAIFSQLMQGMHLSGSTNLGNNVQNGSIFSLLNPFALFGNAYNAPPQHHKNVLDHIASLTAGQKNEPSDDPGFKLIFVINNRKKAEANRLLNGKTPNETLSKVKQYFDKDKLTSEEKFFMAWKLYNLFTNFEENDDETNKELIKMIIRMGEDPRFDELFNILKTKEDSELIEMWKLFKNSEPMLNEKYLSIVKTSPGDKIIQHPSHNCIIINLAQETVVSKKKRKKHDDGKIELVTRGLDLPSNYLICCIDDNNEIRMDLFFDHGSNDEVLSKIKEYLDKDKIDPKHAWYIILKLYKMFDNLNKDDQDKTKIIHTIMLVGKDPKFEKLFDIIRAKKDPRFQKIGETFNTAPKDLEESVNKKLPPKKEPELDPKSESQQNPPAQKTEDGKVTKDEKESQKERETIANSNPPPSTQPPEKVEKPPSTSTPPKETAPNRGMSLSDVIRNYKARVIKQKAQNCRSPSEIAYPDLEQVEILLKDPGLDVLSKHDMINFVHKWQGSFDKDEKMKKKFEELVDIIKANPENNNYLQTLNTVREEPQSTDEAKKTLLKPPVNEIHGLSGGDLVGFLDNMKDVLNSPSLDLKSRINLIKFVNNWHNVPNLDENVKKQLDGIIDTFHVDSENYKILETVKQTA